MNPHSASPGADPPFGSGDDHGDDAAAAAIGPRPGPRPGRRKMSPARRRVVTTLGVLAFLAVPLVAGYEVGRRGGGTTDADPTSAFVPEFSTPVPSGDGSTPVPTTDGSAAADRPDSSSSADLAEVAARVADVVVNITTDVEGGGQASGTGIVISADGLVLTNNHVISGATGLTVELAATGETRSARVLGYNVVDDVALIQVHEVSGLKAAEIGSSSSLAIGETVLAVGNAGGRGGSPSVISGTVTALDQEITAANADGSDSQTLDNLIMLAANIQSGDSGGPVVDTDGTVVGMTVAASVGNSFGLPGRSGGGDGFAIPIEDAVAIAKKIASGEGGPDIRVGATRAVLGVQVQPSLTTQRAPGGSISGPGARVVGVEAGSGADEAGLEAGDMIVALEDRFIRTTSDLTRALVPYDPGESVEVTWVDSDGQTRHGEVELGEGPPG